MENDELWARIVSNEDEIFYQKRGKAFTYKIVGSSIIPGTTKYAIHRSNFEKALKLMPLHGPGEINYLRGPSYVYALVMDRRVAGE